MLAASGLAPLGGRTLQCKRTGRLGRAGGQTRATTVCLMGGYQYRRRVDRLQRQGVPVHDFGSRVLKEQCYGDDVASLQQFLGEQGYLHLDATTGYFGSVTREAVQNWQRDQGLPITGVFTQDCKWAYIKQQEAKVAEAARPVVAVPVSTPPAPVPYIAVPNPLALMPAWQVYLGAAALAAAAAFADTAPRRKAPAQPRPNPLPKLGRALLQGAKMAGAAASGMLVLAASLILAALGAVFRGLRVAAGAAVALTKVALGLTVSVVVGTVAITFSVLRFLAGIAATGAVLLAEAATPVLLGAWQRAVSAYRAQQSRLSAAAPEEEEEEEEYGYVAEEEALLDEELELRYAAAMAAAAAEEEEAAYAAAVAAQAGAAAGPGQQPAPRLSEEELQRRIAIMKGSDAAQRNPVQRPAPRPLETGKKPGGRDPFVKSKYGNYYGGKAVREQIKEYLDDRKGPLPANARSGRMESMGYPLKRSNRSNGAAPATPPPAPTPSRPDRPFNPPAKFNPLLGVNSQAGPGFQDVDGAEPLLAAGGNSASATALASGLLSGTELEALPEGPLRPVRVVRPGGFERPAGASGSVAEEAGPPTKPVPVVKGPTTVGEMMRAAEAEAVGVAQPAAMAQQPAAGAAQGVAVAQGPVPVQKPVRREH